MGVLIELHIQPVTTDRKLPIVLKKSTRQTAHALSSENAFFARRCAKSEP